MQNLHLILDSDRQSRPGFAYYCQNHLSGYSNFILKSVFTDEQIFCHNGRVNTQNVRIWRTDRPFEGSHVPVHSSGVIGWCAINKRKVISPYM